MKVKLLYDSDAATNDAAKRTFVVNNGRPMQVLAAGLVAGEAAPIYVRVGETHSDPSAMSDDDYLWAPLTRCGSPVELSVDNTEHIELVPGTYILGDPSTEPVFSGDVNISVNELRDVPPEYFSHLLKCDGVSTSDPAAPDFVEVTNFADMPLGIEAGIAPLGCTESGGKVFLCKTVDEETGATTWQQVLVEEGAAPVVGYTGPWQECITESQCLAPSDLELVSNNEFAQAGAGGSIIIDWDQQPAEFQTGSVTAPLGAALWPAPGPYLSAIRQTLTLEPGAEYQIEIIAGSTGSLGSMNVVLDGDVGFLPTPLVPGVNTHNFIAPANPNPVLEFNTGNFSSNGQTIESVSIRKLVPGPCSTVLSDQSINDLAVAIANEINANQSPPASHFPFLRVESGQVTVGGLAIGSGASVYSLTLTVQAGSVEVMDSATGLNTIVPAVASFTWGEGDASLLDVSNISFVGQTTDTVFYLHGEYEV